MAHPSLSGVAPERVIELGPGLPALTVDQANRLILRHGLNRDLARALVQEGVAAVVALTPQEEEALTAAFLDREAGSKAEGTSERWRSWAEQSKRPRSIPAAGAGRGAAQLA